MVDSGWRGAELLPIELVARSSGSLTMNLIGTRTEMMTGNERGIVVDYNSCSHTLNISITPPHTDAYRRKLGSLDISHNQ